MAPTREAINRLQERLRLGTPLLAVYDSAPDEGFEPTIEAKGHACVFTYYPHWLEDKTTVIRRDTGDFGNPKCGCPGAQRAFGLVKEYPPYMAHFLTDGAGAPMGEGLMAGPELAQEFLDRSKPVDVSGDSVLVGPLRPEKWDSVKSVTFLVDADRLAGAMRLAGFWTSDPDLIAAPFSSGCGLIWRELENQDKDRAIIGCTDFAMRRYIPPEILSLTVTPARFEQMLGFPDTSFLYKSWWNELMDSR